jgi:AraC-like DNA-binding protein
MECRFRGDGAFIRAFRRQFGVTPEEAREFADQKFTGHHANGARPLAE